VITRRRGALGGASKDAGSAHIRSDMGATEDAASRRQRDPATWLLILNRVLKV
jgi:hypothetical protein